MAAAKALDEVAGANVDAAYDLLASLELVCRTVDQFRRADAEGEASAHRERPSIPPRLRASAWKKCRTAKCHGPNRQAKHPTASALALSGLCGCRTIRPSTDLSRALLVATLNHQGRLEEAQAMWAELMEINPDYSFAEKRKTLPYKNPADLERIAEGLRKAGIEA